MESFRIYGGNPLCGQTLAGSAKNAVLPILAATMLCGEPVTLRACPHLTDVDNMLQMLREVGCKALWDGDDIRVDARDAGRHEMPEALSKEMRSSIFMVGPALARFGRVVFTYPGGCEIGLRPIDLHLFGLKQLGANLHEEAGMIECEGRLTGARVHLDYPSVGATENVMMAAVLARGTSTITNAAREPEIVDLARFINACGGRISGAGTDTITVEGVERLGGATYQPMSDRIVAGTWMIAAAMTRGDVHIPDGAPTDLLGLIEKLRQMGCDIDTSSGIRVRAAARPVAPRLIETQPHPGFPTDMQAQIMAACTLAQGTSVIVENVFENRFGHAAELMRMGADIVVKDRMAVVNGVSRLRGARVLTRDLRGGAALVLAGLAAEGVTEVTNIRLIDRGYDRIETHLREIGAHIDRVM